MLPTSIRNIVQVPFEARLRRLYAATNRVHFGLLLGSIGLAFAISGLTLWFVAVRPQTTQLNQAILGIIVHVIFGYIVVMGGIVVIRSNLSVPQCAMTIRMSLAGAAAMGLLVVWRWMPELLSGAVPLQLINELVIVSSVGAAAGVLVGLNRGQALQNRELVSKKADREETLVFLLRLLEHDIQNHLVAISEHANSIRASSFDPSPTPAEAIEDRTASIERLLETANVVLESETGDREVDRVNVAAVLREQVAVIRSDAPSAEIEVDIDNELYARSDRFVGEVFQNILDNAIVHNRTDELTISVSATVVDDEWIQTDIVDNGSGISPSIRENLFDPGVHSPDSPGDGVGLYLVQKLLTGYGGSVSVSDHSPSGTGFHIQLPRASDTESPP